MRALERLPIAKGDADFAMLVPGGLPLAIFASEDNGIANRSDRRMGDDSDACVGMKSAISWQKCCAAEGLQLFSSFRKVGEGGQG